ncbi:MAG: hypothetical protein KKG93_07445 [Bacteroidetes bacterium]|nr:hypothetical protein [Bacteroidota bacterium]
MKLLIKKIIAFAKKYAWQSFTFLLATLVVILLTKSADNIFPNDPVVVKEYAGSIKVIHSYELPNISNDDSLQNILQKKINQISQLKLYEKEVEEYLNSIKDKESTELSNIPIRIITKENKQISKKGYTQGSSQAFFTSQCPPTKNKNGYFDFQLTFLSPEIFEDIFCLRFIIYKMVNNEYSTNYFDELYEVRRNNNFIRISDDLPKGKYEFRIGVIIKRDLNNEYPTFYSKRCYKTIE